MNAAHWSKDGKNTLCGLALAGKMCATFDFEKPRLGTVTIALDEPSAEGVYCPVCARLAAEIGLPPIYLGRP